MPYTIVSHAMPHNIASHAMPRDNLILSDRGFHQWRGFEPTMYTYTEYQGEHDSLIGRELQILPGTECTYRADEIWQVLM